MTDKVDEEFLVARVSSDTKIIGIDHPTEANWFDVLAAHIALRDRLNERIAEMNACPHKPVDPEITSEPLPDYYGVEKN